MHVCLLFIPFLLEKRAVLFDLGDIHSLSAKDILKISHVFITHTHIDHFCGFDMLNKESEDISSSSVQIGNPIVEKKALDAILKARDLGLYSRIQD